MFLAHDHHDEKDPYLVAPQYRMISLQIVWLNDTVISVHRSHEPPTMNIEKSKIFIKPKKSFSSWWTVKLQPGGIFFQRKKINLERFLIA